MQSRVDHPARPALAGFRPAVPALSNPEKTHNPLIFLAISADALARAGRGPLLARVRGGDARSDLNQLVNQEFWFSFMRCLVAVRERRLFSVPGAVQAASPQRLGRAVRCAPDGCPDPGPWGFQASGVAFL